MRFGHAIGFTVACMLASSTLATAGTFDIKVPEVEKGEREAEHNTTFFSGFPVNADPLRVSTETAFGYGLTDWWNLSGKVNADKPVDDDWQVSTVGLENVFVIRPTANGFGLGWYGGLDVRVHRDETNTFTMGPIFQFGDDKASITLNPFLARTFGANHTEGLDFVYGWQAKRELRKDFAIGIEGYGVIPNIGNAPGSDFQEHRIGPMLYIDRDLGGGGGKAKGSIKDAGGAEEAKGAKLSIEAGVLFGLTEGTQDAAYKVKASIAW